VTGRPIRLAELPGSLRGLLGHAAVVAVAPADAASTTAGEAAWVVARAAARLGRRTMLVDCFVDAPRLHAAIGASSDDGIVDAFEYGASLNHIAQRQPGTDLFFVPTGTFATDPTALLANPRWARLAAGFRHEGALLVLYVPAGALRAVVPWIDLVVVLAEGGAPARGELAAGVASAEGAGRAVLVVDARTAAQPPLPFELVSDDAAEDDGPVFELVPEAGDEPGPRARQAGTPASTGPLDAGAKAPAGQADDDALPAFDLDPDAESEGTDLPAYLIPQAGGPETGGVSLELPDTDAFELPPPPPKQERPDPGVGGYAPTAYTEPPGFGYAPTAFDQPPRGTVPVDEPAPEAAPDAPAPEPEAALRPALRRPLLSELDALRAPARTRRTLLYALGFTVAVWLAMAALRPEWVLPLGRLPEEPPPAPRRGAAELPVSLPYVVLVSAWNDMSHALEAMDTLAARGVRALVTPLRVPRGITYRVQAGPFETKPEADALLDTLRAAGLADPEGSVSLELPLSLWLVVRPDSSPDAVRAERDSLRAEGVAAFLLAEPGGRLHLYAGAFEHADEAQVLDSILFTLHRARRLGGRVGTLP
jgi:hypothetical protein